MAKTRSTSSSRPFSATSSMRSCALREHDLVAGHAGFALRHVVELDLEADAAARAHLAGGAGEAGGAHVLNADDRAGLHRFEAGLEQQLLHEGIAHLHVGALLLGAFGELLAGHGGAVDAVAAGLGADVDHRIADAGGLGVEDLVACGPGRARRRSPADCRCSRARSAFRRRGWARRSSCRSRRCRRRRLRRSSGSCGRCAGSDSPSSSKADRSAANP